MQDVLSWQRRSCRFVPVPPIMNSPAAPKVTEHQSGARRTLRSCCWKIRDDP